MADPYSELIAAYISSKGGSDFSSNSVDPVMQYLLGNYQSAPQFTQDDLYKKFAPNIRAANNSLNPAFKQAADMIKSGTPSWELWTNKDLIKSSGLKADEWKNFVESLAQDNQKVLVAMMDQSMEQDYFQRQGMPGARETYLDKNADGGLKNIGAAYKYAPEQFDALIGNLPQQQTADAARNKAIDAKYGAVIETDEKRKRKLLFDRAFQDLSAKEQKRWKKENKYILNDDGTAVPYLNTPGDNKGGLIGNALKSILPYTPSKGFQNPVDSLFGTKPFIDRLLLTAGINKPANMTSAAAMQADRELKMNSAGVEDKAASARSKSYGNFLKSLQDRTGGSAADSNRRAQETALQILTSLAAQGATPLNDSILSNVKLKRSTRNG
jgi:hypothetical protein